MTRKHPAESYTLEVDEENQKDKAVQKKIEEPETEQWLSKAKETEKMLAAQDTKATTTSVRNILDDPETDRGQVRNLATSILDDPETNEWLARAGKISTRPRANNVGIAANPGRQRVVETQSQPGAFYSFGSSAEGQEPRDNNRFAEGGAEAGGGAAPTPGQEGLAEANPVENGGLAPETEAIPFDAEAAQRRKEEQALKQKKTLCLLAVILSLLAVGIIIAFVFGGKKGEVQTIAPEPTGSPSLAPTGAPSSAPTGVLDALMEDLQEHTLSKLENSSTPQARGYGWLLNHPDLPEIDEWRKMQLFAMATFFYSMEGTNWPTDYKEGWMLDEEPECQWFSNDHGSFNSDHAWVEYSLEHQALLPSVCTEDNRMQVVSLNGIREWEQPPIIPPEIGLLHSLKKFRLSSNYIHGNLSQFLPTEFFELANLTEVDLGKNNLAGTIPTEFGQLTGLAELHLPSNALTGTIPSELGLLNNAARIYLHFQQLNGQIPTQFGMLSSMETLILAGNALTGPIPSQLGLLTTMTSTYIWGNHFTGSFPTEIGMLTNLIYAHMFNAGLTGTIPSEIGLLNLIHIYLWDNFFSGPIPSQIGILSKTMDDLQVPRNALSGQVPSEMGLFTSMTILHLSGNRLTGPLPTELGMLTSMSQLHLNENQFSGSIPSEMGMMGAMVADLNIRNNVLTGTIPSELGLLSSMTTLQLYNNQLTGTIPHELFLNGTLLRLNLENNTGLSGTLPEELCSLGLYNPNFDLGLSFDCSDQLCGCCWCPCPGSNTSAECGASAVDPILSSDLEWPGLFPTNSTNAININFRTDPFPTQLSVEWNWQGESGEWELVELFEPDKPNEMYDYTVEVKPDSLYQLSLFDSNGDGACCDYGYGWFSITTSAPSPDHEDGTVIWSKTGEFGYTHVVLLQVDSDGNVEFIPDEKDY